MKRINSKKNKRRKIDNLAEEVNFNLNKKFLLITKKEIRTWKAISVIAFVFAFYASIIWISTSEIRNASKAGHNPARKQEILEIIKRKGCVFDGLLNNYNGDTAYSISLLERSQCRYAHRAVETWLTPPDFSLIRGNMAKIKKNGVIYGMFIAEAINPAAVYYDPERGANFNFQKMCKEGSHDFWGQGTCKADFRSPEYRKYLSYITRKAIDLGIETFLLGQVNFQDSRFLLDYEADEIVSEIRNYASSKNKTVVIGAQTGDIDSEKYLKNFDYIEGGVGLYKDGETIDQGPCYSKWWKKKGDRCWPMLWHEKYLSKANNVIIHLDWSGLSYDDMSKFARMEKNTRTKALKNLYRYFTSKNVGFLMPFSAVLYPQNGGCFGHDAKIYSADNKYSCQDEDEINSILGGNFNLNESDFIGQNIYPIMVAGEKYKVSVTVRNSGLLTWTKKDLYRLGSQSPQDNNFWGGRILIPEGEEIRPGQEKTFVFEVMAPTMPGTYDFQWRMLQEDVEWFGDYTENAVISVIPR